MPSRPRRRAAFRPDKVLASAMPQQGESAWNSSDWQLDEAYGCVLSDARQDVHKYA